MQRIEQLTALPGCCWKCRSSNREWYLDLDISIDFYGAVYICCECIIEMGHIAGMATPQEVTILRDNNLRLEDEKFDFQVKISGLEQAIDGLRIAGRSIGPDSLNHPVTPNADRQKDLLAEGAGVEQEGNGPSQPLHDKGMAELSNDGGPESGSAFKLSL